MAKKVFAVDVDVTLIDTSCEWWKWLESKTGKGLRYDFISSSYDLTIHYKEELQALGLDGLEFWRRSDLYDEMYPRQFAVDVLRELSEEWDVVFVSQLKGDHHKSKVNLLKRYFPFMAGFIGTKEKQFVHCDAAIEDRHKHLWQFHSRNPNAVLMLFESPHKQDVVDAPDRSHKIFSWGQVPFVL